MSGQAILPVERHRRLTIGRETNRIDGAGMAGQVEQELDLQSTVKVLADGSAEARVLVLTSSSCVFSPRTSLMRQRPTRWLLPQVARRGRPGCTSQLLRGSLFSLQEI